MQQRCVFCDLAGSDRVVAANDHCFAVRDIFPVTKGHTLVITNRHVKDFFGMNLYEREACWSLLCELRKQLLEEDPVISGFNIGMNCGEDAGQTVFHLHIHLIPRRPGDTWSPRGGVRGVINHRMDERDHG